MTLAAYTAVGLPLALALIMFSMGVSLLPGAFLELTRQPRALFVGLFGQLVLVPLLAMIVIVVTGLSGSLAVGLLVLSFSPGGTTSNLFSYLAKGDVPLSVLMTAIAGVVTPFSLPLLTSWALQWQLGRGVDIDFPVGLTMLRLGLVVLLPLLLGMCWRYLRPDSASTASAVLRPAGMLAFASVIVVMVVQRWPVLGGWLEQLGLPVVLLLLVSLTTGWLLACAAGLGVQQCKTIGIEVGMQNGGMALLVTQGVLSDAQMSSVPLLYGLLMLLPVLVLVGVGCREKN